MEELIAKRYAKALMDISDESALKADVESLKKLASTVNEKDVKELVVSPLISNDKKFSILVEPLKGKIGDKLYRLLSVMSSHGRLSLIPSVAEFLEYEMKKVTNSFEGTLLSDGSIKRGDIAKLEKSLSDYTGANIKLINGKEKIDGIKVEVEDLGIELSYSKERIKADLLAFIQQGL